MSKKRFQLYDDDFTHYDDFDVEAEAEDDHYGGASQQGQQDAGLVSLDEYLTQSATVSAPRNTRGGKKGKKQKNAGKGKGKGKAKLKVKVKGGDNATEGNQGSNSSKQAAGKTYGGGLNGAAVGSSSKAPVQAAAPATQEAEATRSGHGTTSTSVQRGAGEREDEEKRQTTKEQQQQQQRGQGRDEAPIPERVAAPVKLTLGSGGGGSKTTATTAAAATTVKETSVAEEADGGGEEGSTLTGKAKKPKKKTKKSSKGAKTTDDGEDAAAISKRKWKKPKTISRMKLEHIAPPTHLENNINLVIIGHVDAGKSTMVGHLLAQMGEIDPKLLHKCKQESSKMGKGSFAFAWLLDEEAEERARGVTVDVGQKTFSTASRRFTLLDAPGHRDFIPNMITGASHADAAVLVVDASPGEFESGFDADGQTREHILLARSLGINQLVVAVNKMDMVEWSKERYDEVVGRLQPFLKQRGFDTSSIAIVPVSGLSGLNLTEQHPLPWYSGPTLLKALDSLRVRDREWRSALRATISDVFKVAGFSSVHAAARIVTGCVHEADTVVVLPNFEYGTVKQVQVGDEKAKAAYSGDVCTLVLGGIDETNIRAGNLICHPEEEPPLATRIRCKIVVFDAPRPLLKGSQFTLHHQQEDVPARIKSFVAQTNPKTGEVERHKPRALPRNSVGVVVIQLDTPLSLEPYERVKDLGRVTLRQEGRTVAAGIIEEIVRAEKIE